MIAVCGRFTQRLTWRELAELYGLVAPASTINPPVRWNGAPTQDFAACLKGDNGGRTIKALRWGLVPHWAKDSKMGAQLINARAETVHIKPAFRHAFKRQRCLIPANGWFEWKRDGGKKRPFLIGLADGSPLSFAGLWARWGRDGEVVESFAIITTAAHPHLSGIHDRQPAIIPPDGFSAWLDPDARPGDLLELARAPFDGPYHALAVSDLVNNARNDAPEVVAPAGGAPRPAHPLA